MGGSKLEKSLGQQKHQRPHFIVTLKILGYKVSKEAESLLRKFAQQVEKIFINLPKPLEWRSFYRHDLPILMDICEKVQKVSIQNDLNKFQTKALAKLKKVSGGEFNGMQIRNHHPRRLIYHQLKACLSMLSKGRYPQRPIEKGLTTINSRKPFIFVVGGTGFEPVTSTV